MESDMELKVIDDEQFIINILAELFAYEIFVQALELGLDELNIETVYSSVHTEFNHEKYKEDIYNKTEELLKDKYRIEMKLE